MIGFLFPAFLYAAGGVTLGVVALHFLVTQQPRSDVLPTVRFFPDVVARSTSITIKPSDLWLLLLRALMILLIGAAFAQPQLKPSHRPTIRLVAVDVSRSVGNRAELADSASRYLTDAAAIVLFDSAAHEVPAEKAADSLRALSTLSKAGDTSAVAGRMSPALIALLRAAARLREGADSLELIVISPFAREEADAATQTIRALWPGHLRPVRAGTASDVSAGDSAKQVTAKPARVEWADSGVTELWMAKARPDTIGAVRAGDNVLVYPFVRRWSLKEPSNAAAAPSIRVYARWSDGEPAAVERTSGDECIRSLAVALPQSGDAMLRPEFVRFTDALSAPCGEAPDLAPLSMEFLTALAGPEQLAAASAVTPRITKMTPLVPWVLGAALLLAVFELRMRRRAESSVAADDAAEMEKRAA